MKNIAVDKSKGLAGNWGSGGGTVGAVNSHLNPSLNKPKYGSKLYDHTKL
jgi:hypothetical protein